MQRFVKWYNHEHKHSGLNFLSPIERHTGLDKEIFEKRIAVYEVAKNKHPERWTKEIRNWSLEDKVFLNPERATKTVDKESNEAQAS